PIEFARAWVGHAPHERGQVARLEWNVNRIQPACSERGVVYVRRERVHDGRTDETEHLCPLIKRVDAVNVTQLGGARLAGRGRMFKVERAVREERAARG